MEVLVIHHVGGLKGRLAHRSKLHGVIHHVGGLKGCSWGNAALRQVIHRIGGLKDNFSKPAAPR